ncbi:MAG: TlpA disulfide reductase family protein [Gammaproteobacteria bacterium]
MNLQRLIWATVLLVVAAMAPAAPAPGSAAPDFTLKSDSGRNLKLSELRGEVVMINFWATWCAPCREEMPLLNQLYEQYRKVGFTLLAINVDDDPAKARTMARKLGVSFPVLFDTDKRVSKLYDVAAMPSTLLIDRDGRVRYVHRGYVAGVEQKYQTQVRELLAQ